MTETERADDLQQKLTEAFDSEVLTANRAHKAELAVGTLQTALRQLVDTLREHFDPSEASPLQHHGPCGFWRDKPCTCPIRVIAKQLEALLPALEPTP